MSKYSENQVLSDLRKKNDLHIVGKQIQELKRFPGPKGTPSRGDVGIKTRGKIDFLVNYLGYLHIYVSNFSK